MASQLLPHHLIIWGHKADEKSILLGKYPGVALMIGQEQHFTEMRLSCELLGLVD